MEPVTWFCVEGKGPEWVRCVARDDAGDIYVPAAAFDNEKAILLAVAFDGVPVVLDDKNHIYVSTTWLRKNYGDDKEGMAAIAKIEYRIANEKPVVA